MDFPKDFLWGAASSAPQIEGAWDEDGRSPSIWDNVPANRIKDGSSCHTACDHYHRYREDIALMGQMGLKSYRFSVSWSRIQPEPGKVNPKGIAFYNSLIDELLAAGIEPMITIFHWDLPMWAHKQGGWKNEKIVDWLRDYTKILVEAFSDRVQYWMTINEPQVFIMSAYVMGNFAPFEHRVFTFRKHLRHALLAHGRAVQTIRAYARKSPIIGLAMASTTYIPDGDSAEALEDARQKSFLSMVGQGSNSLYMDPIVFGSPTGMLKGTLRKEDLKIISEPIDFIGLNIYTPSNGMFRKTKAPENGETDTQMGWKIDSRCMYWTIRQYYDRYHLPIMVTENGLSLPDTVSADGQVHDNARIEYLKDFLPGVGQALSEGIPVLGYQYWSVMDNFEWCQGYEPRFGLIHVDYTTQKRTIKDSGFAYRKIIETAGAELAAQEGKTK